MEGVDLAEFRRAVTSQLKEKRWSGRQLAHEAGLNPSTVSKLLRAVGPRPEARTVLAIAQALDLVRLLDSTSSLTGEDYASGYRDGWKDGWDAAVRVLRGPPSGSTPSPP